MGADFSPEKMRAGPSFRDTFVHHTKHRRLGCVMGLVVRGLLEPSLLFYAIQNPYAHSHLRLANGDIERMRRFTWTEDGHGNESAGLRSEEVWRLMNGEQS